MNPNERQESFLIKNKVFLARNGFSPYGGFPDPQSDRHWSFDSGMGHIHKKHCYTCGKKASHIAKYTIQRLKEVDIVALAISTGIPEAKADIYDFQGNITGYCKVAMLDLLIRRATATECRVCEFARYKEKKRLKEVELELKIKEQDSEKKFKKKK